MGGKQQHVTSSAGRYATYNERTGNRVTLYQLGSAGKDGTSGAFKDLTDAINAASKFIFICDWSFQPYVRMGPRTSPPNINQTIGAMLNLRAKAGALVAIHVWDHTNLAAYDDWNDNGNKWLDEIAKQVSSGAEKARSSNILWRSTSRTGVGYSFHQKYVILDADDAVTGKKVVKAFFGGLDITKGRFDWGEHPILDNPGANPWVGVNNGKEEIDDWYSQEFQDKKGAGAKDMPRQPWQDYYASIVGPAAWDMLREFVGRWDSDNHGTWGPNGDFDSQAKKRVEDVFKGLFDDGSFAKEWDDHQGPFVARVVRSIEKVDWRNREEMVVVGRAVVPQTVECETTTQDGKKQKEFHWASPVGVDGKPNNSFENSIEQAYVNAILNANRFIYIETQYFIGSGPDWGRDSVKNRIPHAIVDKITEKINAGQEFHAYIIIPMFPEGDPTAGAEPDQRKFEWLTMQSMIKGVQEAIDATGKTQNWAEYLTFYFLVNWKGAPSPAVLTGDRKSRVKANQRYKVYVHSKLMIIDDQFLIVGSANLNERSLAGDRDTEICIYLRPGDGKLADCQKIIGDLRKAAWSDHLGGALPPDVDNPEKKSCWEGFTKPALGNWYALWVNTRATPLGMEALTGAPGSHIVVFPFDYDSKAKKMTIGNSLLDLLLTPTVRYQEKFIYDATAKAVKPKDTNGSFIKDEWLWDSHDGDHLPGYLAE
jgi:phospholipase D1/2